MSLNCTSESLGQKGHTDHITVAELVARLSGLPPELPVLVEGYESGWDAINDIRTATLVRRKQITNCDGEYEELEEGELEPASSLQAVLIAGIQK